MPIAPQVIPLLVILVGAQCKRLAPLHAAGSPDSIEGEYIIVLHSYLVKEQVNAHIEKVSGRALLEQQTVSEKWEDDTAYTRDEPTDKPGDVVPEYRSKQMKYGITSTFAIGKSQAYSARLSDSLRDSIRSMREVKYVQRNQEVTLAACSTQSNADWGIARTTTRNPLKVTLPPYYPYVWGSSGEGVNIYIIDSGINLNNAEFENRAIWGTDVYSPVKSPKSDPFGHGTKVAGIAISKTYGIAKKATAIAVRVFGPDGESNDALVIRGISWATAQHSTGKKSIINLSSSGSISKAVNDAVKAATNKGIYVVSAAGNEGTDVCTRSPASAPSSITVMASDPYETFATFSNFGSCAHIIAPGVSVTTINGVEDGTSFSAPMVAGVIAKHIGPLPANQIPTPAIMKEYLISTSLSDMIRSVPPQTPNKLLYYPCSA